MMCPVCTPETARMDSEEAERARAVQRAVEAAQARPPFRG
jgi:hypothetical protein